MHLRILSAAGGDDMFCTLTIYNGKRQKGAPTYRRPIVIRRECVGGSYDLIRARKKKGRLNIRKLEQAIGDRPVICQAGIDPPHGCRLNLFDSGRYRKLLSLNSAAAVLSIASRYKRNISVAFIDPSGQYCGFAERLMPIAEAVYIITNSIESYSLCANRCYTLFGAAPVISDGYGIIEKCGVVISPDGYGVFSADKCIFAPQNEFWHVERGCIAAVDGCPEGVDEVDFAAALYECCSARRMATLAAEHMIAGGQKHTLEAIAHRICLDIR